MYIHGRYDCACIYSSVLHNLRFGMYIIIANILALALVLFLCMHDNNNIVWLAAVGGHVCMYMLCV